MYSVDTLGAKMITLNSGTLFSEATDLSETIEFDPTPFLAAK